MDKLPSRYRAFEILAIVGGAADFYQQSLHPSRTGYSFTQTFTMAAQSGLIGYAIARLIELAVCFKEKGLAKKAQTSAPASSSH